MADKYKYNVECKVNGTERSILTSLSQTLKLVANNVTNNVTSGKVPGFLFAACKINKFNMNIVDFSAALSKLKTTENMYGIELKVAIATVSEMQRVLKFPQLNDKYMKVRSLHPSDTDEIALKCYHYLWVTTPSFEVTDPSADFTTSMSKGPTVTNGSNTSNTTSNYVSNTEPGRLVEVVEADSSNETSNDSDDILPGKKGLRDTGKTLGKKQLFSKLL